MKRIFLLVAVLVISSPGAVNAGSLRAAAPCEASADSDCVIKYGCPGGPDSCPRSAYCNSSLVEF